MNSKKLKVIVIILVYIIICLPSIFSNRDSDAISIVENRGLVKKPSWEGISGFNAKYISDVETYIDDNIGFKQTAILIKLGVLYSCFDKFGVPDYLMGKEQNLFYSEGMNQIRNYQGKLQLTDEQTELLMKDFEAWDRIVANNGGKFFFMPIPDKEGIYPELYPDSVLRYSDKSRVDCLTDKMISKEWFINVKKALISEKSDKLLYYRNYDPAHWNMNGAWVGYKELMNHIISDYEDVKMLTEKDVIFTWEEGPGTWLNLSGIKCMGNIMKFEDDMISCVPIGGFKSEKVENDSIISLVENQIYYHYTNQCIKGKTLLIAGDSYVHQFLLPLLAESFSDVYFTNYINAEVVDELYKKVQPDIVVIETVDRAFYYWYMVENMERLVELNSTEIEE